MIDKYLGFDNHITIHELKGMMYLGLLLIETFSVEFFTRPLLMLTSITLFVEIN